MISDEAVEAAAEAIGAYNAKAIGGTHVPLKDLSGLDREHALGEARAALDAAAPHMLADLLDKLDAVRALVYDSTLAGGCVMHAINPEAIRSALGDNP